MDTIKTESVALPVEDGPTMNTYVAEPAGDGNCRACSSSRKPLA